MTDTPAVTSIEKVRKPRQPRIKDSLADIRAQKEALIEQEKALIQKEAETIAKFAVQTGLAELGLAHDEIKHELSQIVERRRKAQPTPFRG